jgi:photosystem I reaction center subunit XII|uniref:Photosystem I reaction center subunit XII n=1 Tax=Attheya longicornis TaxID=451786 RepID=A0A2U9NPQ6_9STRA|nr:photosystem I protein M [Attheya longicornis]AWT39062.1 photosystem I protein M [Attheya longicornis]
MINDSQVYTLLFVALLAGTLAVRLGATLYQ